MLHLQPVPRDRHEARDRLRRIGREIRCKRIGIRDPPAGSAEKGFGGSSPQDADVREYSIELVLDSLTWHPRIDPGLQHFDEVLVRERGSRAPARGPGPEDERIRLHVLDDLLSRATA